jgi:hypothetical protein
MLHSSQHDLSEMETKENTVPVGCGSPIGTDAIWLAIPNEGISPRLVTNDDKAQTMLWAKRHHVLAEHVEYVSREMKCRRLLNE